MGPEYRTPEIRIRRAYLEKVGVDLVGLWVAVQGFGNVGSFAALGF